MIATRTAGETAGRRRPARALPLVIALAVAAAVGAVLYLGSRSASHRRELDERLMEADDALSLGYLDRAEERIRLSAEAARSERDWLRVLKRGRQLARAGGDHRPLAGLAERAVERIGGSARLRLVAAWALLRAEQPDRAMRHLDGRWRSAAFRREPLSSLLWTEVLLESGAGEEAGAELPEDLRGLLRAEGGRDPAELSSLARRFQEPRFTLDAALLAMRLGRPQEAFRLMQGAPAGQAEPAFLIAYDAGEDQAALEKLQELLQAPAAAGTGGPRPDLQAMLGDLLVLTGDPGGAAEVYLSLARESPRYSWKPFLNLAALLERGGDPGAARLYRQRAVDVFPEERQVLASLIRDLQAREGAEEELRHWTGEFLARFPDDVESGLLRLQADALRDGAGSGLAARQARYWALFHRFPADEGVCRLVTLQMLAVGDLAGARAALKLHAEASGESRAPWQLHLLGVVEALEGRPEQAVESFSAALDRSGGDWRLLYDRGLAAAAAGRWRDGLDDLRKAEAGLRAGRLPGKGGAAPAGGFDSDGELLSRLRARMGLLHLKLGETEAGRRELRYARELDPDNLQAALLLRKLDEGVEK